MSDNVTGQLGSAHRALGCTRRTTPQFRPLGGLTAAPPAGQTGPTLRQEYVAGSVAPEKTNIALDSPHDRHISHARDGDGSKVSPRRGTSLLASLGVRQTCADRAVGGKSGCVLYL